MQTFAGDKDRCDHTIPDTMKVFKSKIPDAGNGIWSKIKIDRNSCFGPYEGVKVFDKNEAHESGYAWLVRIFPRNIIMSLAGSGLATY